MQRITDMSRRLSIIFVSGLLLSSFTESSILTIMYIFSIFMVLKLCKGNLKIIDLISDHLIFLGSVDIRDCLVVASVER